MRGAAPALSAMFAAALGSCAAMLAPAVALGASNTASTEAYVRANYALTQAAHSHIPKGRANIAALRGRLRRECPAVVAGSPQDTQSEQLTWELIGAMTIVGYQPGGNSATKFARSVAKLSWSNAALTNTVRSFTKQLLAEVRTPLPDLCADLRAWKASGYTTLPATTVHFRESFYENYVPPGFMPKRLLAPYLNSSQAGLVQRARKNEEALAEAEAAEVETFGEIIGSLGLSQ